MKTSRRITSPDAERQNRVPPGQRLLTTWPVLHHGNVPDIPLSGWKLAITGLVTRQHELDYGAFVALPHVEVFSDIHCVTTWSRLDNLWEGVGTQTLRDLVGPLPQAKFVIVRCWGGYSTNLTVEDFFEDDVLLAFQHNGELLSPAHGAPVRLVVPRLYFWKSAKWVSKIEFSDHDQPGFWESYGYHNRGDPWLEERYSR